MRRVSTTVAFPRKHARHIWHASTWERIEPKFFKHPSGCWLWTAGLSHGYAVLGKPYISVHRWMYEQHVGAIPEGLHLDHLCMVTNCINPAHLEPVTPQENWRRASTALTHCIHGHEFTPENTHRGSNGRRGCRTCIARHKRESQQRKVAS